MSRRSSPPASCRTRRRSSACCSRANAVPLPVEAEELLTWLAVERGRATTTLAAYRRDLDAYCAWLGHRALRDVSPDDVAAYIGALRADGKAPASVARAT